MKLSDFSAEVQAQLKKVDLGLLAQQFDASPLGAFLREKATKEVEEKVELLKAHDILGDPKGATRLQSEIWRAESFMYWIGDAIREGRELQAHLTEGSRQAQDGGDVTGS